MKGVPSDLKIRKLVTDIRRNIILGAPAGSGKTSILELRYMRALAHSDAPEQVLAITFTLAAAGEIRERVYSTLIKVSQGAKPTNSHEEDLYAEAAKVLEVNAAKNWGILHDPSRMRIMTIDALNSLISSTLPLVSRSGGALTVEPHPAPLYRDAVINLFADLEDPSAPESLKEALAAVLEFGRHRLDSIIPMLERLLTARDQWLQPLLNSDMEQFEQTLFAMVQTTLEEAEVLITPERWARVVGLLKNAGTSDEILAWAVDLDPATPLAETSPALLTQVANLILTGEGKLRKRVDKRQGFSAKSFHKEGFMEMLAEFHEAADKVSLERAIGMLTLVPATEIGEEGAKLLADFRLVLLRLAAQLQVSFQNHGKVDFIEVHGRAMSALGNEEDGLGEFLIREERIKHIMVDEWQDTSRAQIQLIHRLVAEWSDGDGRSIFFCGDPQQGIYGFRGAEVGEYLQIWENQKFGPKSLERHSLTNNFRSAPELVDFYNTVFTSLFGERSNPWTGRVPFTPATAYVQDRKGSVEVIPFDQADGDAVEAELVCDRIQAELKVNPNAEIAILVRSRSHLKSILPVMHERQIHAAGEDIDQITDKPAIADCVALIRAMVHPGDRTAWTTLLRSPLVGLTWSDCLRLMGDDKYGFIRDMVADHGRVFRLSADGRKRVSRLLRVLYRVEASDRWADVVWRCSCLWNSLGGADTVDEHTLDEIRTVFRVLAECSKGGQLSSLSEFQYRLEKLYAAPKPGAVRVMTIHNAKGLQFDLVFLVGLNKSTPSDQPPLLHWKCVGEDVLLMPRPRAREEDLSATYDYMMAIKKQAAYNEHMRLLYVAMTRAENKLILFAGLNVSEKGEISATNRTFMHMLLPFIEEECFNVESRGEANSDRVGRLVSIARLPSTYQGPHVSLDKALAGGVSGLPTEAIIGSAGTDARINAGQRAAGTVFHYMMERIKIDGVEKWGGNRGAHAKQAIIALLRRNGCPDNELAEMSVQVSTRVDNTLKSEVGQWLLKRREQQWVEYRISGKREGRWFSDVMDLVFIEDGVVWVVDYKSIQNEQTSVSQIIARYREQMQRYTGTLQKRFPGAEVRPLIFNSAKQELIDLSRHSAAA